MAGYWQRKCGGGEVTLDDVEDDGWDDGGDGDGSIVEVDWEGKGLLDFDRIGHINHILANSNCTPTSNIPLRTIPSFEPSQDSLLEIDI